MSNGNSGERHGRRGHQHRAEMREKARELRHAQRKRDRRGRAAVLISIVTVAVAVIVGVTLVVLQGIPTPSAGPRNMASDGILIGQGLQAVRTEALQPGDEPSASPSPVATPPAEADATEAPTENPVAIRLYYDFQCEDCAEFLTANSEQIETWLGRGAATFELHPIVLQSQGTQYSQRAVNAAACVADLNPDGFWDFNRSLLGEQPEEGLEDDALVALAADSGTPSDGVETCIRERQFRTWVTDVTQRALDGPIPDSDVERITETPTILVNGQRYVGGADAVQFASFVQQASAERFTDESATTPSPTATPAG